MKNRPVLFLDFDDVICLNKTCGGSDAVRALGRLQKEPRLSLNDIEFEELWRDLFDADSKAHLATLHEEFNPHYVLSTSWRLHINKPGLVAILQCCGLGFVAENLHTKFKTPEFVRAQLRAREIGLWLARNTEVGRNWVVLDDESSGTGFADDAFAESRQYIVLCKENVGLTGVELNKLQAAFRARGTI